jgi:hypothetical protein
MLDLVLIRTIHLLLKFIFVLYRLLSRINVHIILQLLLHLLSSRNPCFTFLVCNYFLGVATPDRVFLV